MSLAAAWTALVLLAAGETAPTAPLAEQVRAIVRQLDSPQLTERNEAENKLLNLGTAALPLLPAIGENTSAETAKRLTRVQQKLFEAQANATAEPSRVTLHATDMPLAQVLAAISQQTGNKIVDHRQEFGQHVDEILITINLDKVPYWQALDEVLDQGGLTLYEHTSKSGAFVINRPEAELPRAKQGVYAGAFRVAPLQIEARRDLRNPNLKSLKVHLSLAWEPRLQPYALLQPMADVQAIGDTGEKIPLTDAEELSELSVILGNSSIELDDLCLELPKRDVEKIRSLQGKLWALVPTPAVEFRFANFRLDNQQASPKRVELRKGGAAVSVDRVRKSGETVEVNLRVRLDKPSNSFESHRDWMRFTQAYFLRPDGSQIKPERSEPTLQAKDEQGLSMTFSMTEDPSKLTFVYETPTTILEIPVEYELRDLPLP